MASSSSRRRPARMDLTSTFQSLVASQPTPTSPALRRNPHKPPSKAAAAEVWHRRRRAEKQWNEEAAKLESHVESVHTFLSAVRRPYLHLGPPPRKWDESTRPREFQDGSSSTEISFEASAAPSSSQSAQESALSDYASLTHLTEEQKDEVDLHLKLVLERGIQRLKDLVKAEEARHAALPATPATTAGAGFSLARLLAPPLPPTALDSAEYSSQLHVHREAVTALMGRSLKRAGERIGSLQEARVKALEEKAGTRRVGADITTSINSSSAAVQAKKKAEAERRSKAIPGSTSSFRATTHSNSPGATAAQASSNKAALQQETSPTQAVEELTPAQIQQFSSESSLLTKNLNASLSAVEHISSTLNTISSLQQTLISHLSTQNETLANLGMEAGLQKVEVEGGNQQLRQARERNRSANRMLGAFLVGSGLTLLFLHAMG